jgi:hypothetical protein
MHVDRLPSPPPRVGAAGGSRPASSTSTSCSGLGADSWHVWAATRLGLAQTVSPPPVGPGTGRPPHTVRRTGDVGQGGKNIHSRNVLELKRPGPQPCYSICTKV